MIELLRYARLKPDGLTSTEVNSGLGLNAERGLGVTVKFKRFSVENGREETPEESFILFEELEKHLTELETELGVVKELLALKPK